jgi:hypothetical protein
VDGVQAKKDIIVLQVVMVVVRAAGARKALGKGLVTASP